MPVSPAVSTHSLFTRTTQVTLGVVGVTYAILKARKVKLKRDGSDYKGGLSDFFNIMRNADFEQHKAKDAKTSVDQYAGLFDGARREVGKISSEESIDVRRKEYETMIQAFYDLVREHFLTLPYLAANPVCFDQVLLRWLLALESHTLHHTPRHTSNPNTNKR